MPFSKLEAFGGWRGNQTTDFDPHKEKWDHSPSQRLLGEAPKSLPKKKNNGIIESFWLEKPSKTMESKL